MPEETARNNIRNSCNNSRNNRNISLIGKSTTIATKVNITESLETTAQIQQWKVLTRNKCCTGLFSCVSGRSLDSQQLSGFLNLSSIFNLQLFIHIWPNTWCSCWSSTSLQILTIITGYYTVSWSTTHVLEIPSLKIYWLIWKKVIFCLYIQRAAGQMSSMSSCHTKHVPTPCCFCV